MWGSVLGARRLPPATPGRCHRWEALSLRKYGHPSSSGGTDTADTSRLTRRIPNTTHSPRGQLSLNPVWDTALPVWTILSPTPQSHKLVNLFRCPKPNYPTDGPSDTSPWWKYHCPEKQWAPNTQKALAVSTHLTHLARCHRKPSGDTPLSLLHSAPKPQAPSRGGHDHGAGWRLKGPVERRAAAPLVPSWGVGGRW